MTEIINGDFIVWCEDYGQSKSDGMAVYAFDAAEAAEEWAEIRDRESAEYKIVGGEEIKVRVADLSGREYEYIVRGESTATYFASEISPDMPGDR